MIKTFTKEEFNALTQEVIVEAMNEAEKNEMTGGALMAYTMTYVMAFGELKKKLFDEEDNTTKITIEDEEF